MALSSPPPDAINIGGDHWIEYTEWQAEPAGLIEWHRNKAGLWCRGWVSFKGSPWSKQFEGKPEYQCWTVTQREPLTLMPSIRCRACGNHGFIVKGRWSDKPP